MFEQPFIPWNGEWSSPLLVGTSSKFCASSEFGAVVLTFNEMWKPFLCPPQWVRVRARNVRGEVAEAGCFWCQVMLVSVQLSGVCVCVHEAKLLNVVHALEVRQRRFLYWHGTLECACTCVRCVHTKRIQNRSTTNQKAIKNQSKIHPKSVLEGLRPPDPLP